MDGYDFSDVQGPRGKRPGGMGWNILTILVICTAVILSIIFFLIYINPNSILNPFPPSALHLSATPTLTPSFTSIPSSTPTDVARQPLATNTLFPIPATPDSTEIVENLTSTPYGATVINDYAFIVHPGNPTAADGSQFHPEFGCNWAGIAGQAISLNGEPVKGLFIHLGGSLNGVTSLGILTMTGMAPQYGQGGFEITLSNKPFASQGMLWIQLLDQQNLPMSDRVYIDTYDDCAKNLVMINFDQVR